MLRVIYTQSQLTAFTCIFGNVDVCEYSPIVNATIPVIEYNKSKKKTFSLRELITEKANIVTLKK